MISNQCLSEIFIHNIGNIASFFPLFFILIGQQDKTLAACSSANDEKGHSSINMINRLGGNFTHKKDNTLDCIGGFRGAAAPPPPPPPTLVQLIGNLKKNLSWHILLRQWCAPLFQNRIFERRKKKKGSPCPVLSPFQFLPKSALICFRILNFTEVALNIKQTYKEYTKDRLHEYSVSKGSAKLMSCKTIVSILFLQDSMRSRDTVVCVTSVPKGSASYPGIRFIILNRPLRSWFNNLSLFS